MQTIIQVENLQKRYGDTVAIKDISFEVNKGEIFGIVGPNGAGKTTTVETLIGLRKPDNGRVTVLGLSPQKQRAQLAQRIGIQLQEANLPDKIKVWETLDLFSSFYDHTTPWEPLLTQWGLEDKRNSYVEKLSGGQKQRLFIILALLNEPEIIFLDELTTGLDPQARRSTWEMVQQIRDQGTTVILVTHFMDEAETLADRIAIIDRGQVIALDSPQALIKSLNSETKVTFSPPLGFDPGSLQHVNGVTQVSQQKNLVSVQGHGALLANVATALAEQNITPDDLHVERADLEDVFLALTGKQIRG